MSCRCNIIFYGPGDEAKETRSEAQLSVLKTCFRKIDLNVVSSEIVRPQAWSIQQLNSRPIIVNVLFYNVNKICFREYQLRNSGVSWPRPYGINTGNSWILRRPRTASSKLDSANSIYNQSHFFAQHDKLAKRKQPSLSNQNITMKIRTTVYQNLTFLL